MALANMGLKSPKLVSFWEGEQNVKEKEKTKRKRKKMEEPRSSQGMELLNLSMELWIFVWKLTLIMNSMRFGMDLWVCMMINLLKPRVLLGFHLIRKIMESKVGKTLNSTRRS